MPELPEVETMVQRLQKYVGSQVEFVSPVSESGYKGLPEEEMIEERLNGVFRRGKFMVFMLERRAILAHNAMSGYWDEMDEPWTFDYVEGKRASNESDVRVQIELTQDRQTKILNFHDARKFGSIRVITPEELCQKLSELGPDALSTPNLYTPTEVITILSFDRAMNVKKTVKEALMNQNLLAGVGNIYAAEACWNADIDPHRMARELTEVERGRLLEGVRTVLTAALERRLDYSSLKVYRRKVCCTCNGLISSDKIKGRSTYWCPTCQK